MLNKKLVSTAISLAVIASPLLAEDDFDASDLTSANTTAIVSVSNQGDVKLQGSLSYTFTNGQMAMTSLEGTMDAEGDYQDSRLQYFHVFNLDSAVTPRIAASMDIINNQQFTTAALGSIALFRTPFDSLTFFARGAVLAGEYDKDFAKNIGLNDRSITGAMAAGYAVLTTGSDGTFLAAFPEYTYIKGDLDISTVQTTLMAATPVSADGKRWGQLKLENTSGDMQMGSRTIETPSETVAWFNYKVFF